MPDDEVRPAINRIHLRHVADDVSAASRIALPLFETMRAFENSGLLSAAKALEEQQAALRSALQPLGELQLASRLIADSPLLRDLGRSPEAIATLQSRFVLPDLGEMTRLVDALRSSRLSAGLVGFAEKTTGLRQAIERMSAPWLDSQNALRSIAGPADLHGIGYALRNLAAFDDGLTDALRAGLGDWRDPISWPSEIFTDLEIRTDFYAGLGFDHALTAFPTPAFEEGLDISGVRRDPPPLIIRYEAPVPASDSEEQEEDLARANLAHDWLQRLETQLRAFIDERMTQAFGTDWARHRLPNGMYDQWVEKKRKAQHAHSTNRPLIAYADFTDYAILICRADNWREVFAAFFGRQESVRETFQRLYPIRVDTMHARPITQDDELLLYVEARRLIKMILGD